MDRNLGMVVSLFQIGFQGFHFPAGLLGLMHYPLASMKLTVPVFSGGMLVLLACLLFPNLVSAEDWPQWMGVERDGVWHEEGILRSIPADGLRKNWQSELGAGYSGPAVSNGRVFVMDRTVTAPEGKEAGQNFSRGIIAGTERVVCLDEKTGKRLWVHEYNSQYEISYPSGPRVTPTVDENRVYSLGAEGNLYCLNVENGKVRWSRDFKRDYRVKTPLWGFAAHPLVVGNKLICLVGGRGSTVVAFDKRNGRELWSSLGSREPGYCPPTLIHVGGEPQLIVWHPESVNGLNPENGQRIWSHAYQAKAGLTIAQPRLHGDLLFVSSFYNGPMMMKYGEKGDRPEVLWRGNGRNERNTEGLHSLMATPFIEDGHIYGVGSYGHLRCVNATTGERIWETLEAATKGKPTRWGNAFIVKNHDRFFLFNEQGELIAAELSPDGYKEHGRVHLIEPDNSDPRRSVVWSHPAFANGSILVRNDKEIISYSLKADSDS